MPDEVLLEDEIDRLIRRLGMPAMMDRIIQCFGAEDIPAMIAELERRKKRHHAKRGAKSQKNAVYLFEMARIIYSPQGWYQPRFQGKKLQIGRVAGIIADRHNPKSPKKREALIKTLKRQFFSHRNLLRRVGRLDTSDIQSIISSPEQVDIMRFLEEDLRRRLADEDEERDYYTRLEEEAEEEARDHSLD
jgi:hypothetical protein